MRWRSARPGVDSANQPGALLEVSDLRIQYGRRAVAVQNASLHVAAREIVALLGPNGAGKTSTLRGISGFLAAEPGRLSGGSVRFEGRPITGMPPYRTARLGLHLVPERDKVFAHLSVQQNLFLGVHAAERELAETAFEYFPALRVLLPRTAGYLSGGERQMLALARGIVTGARLLLIDEMSLGLSPSALNQLLRAIKTLNTERGTTILLVEQNAVAALSVASRCYVMEAGRIIAADSSANLKEPLAGLYLGGTVAEEVSAGV